MTAKAKQQHSLETLLQGINIFFATYLIADREALAAVVTAMVAALWLAMWFDVRLGEPPSRWHPVVWMGNYLSLAARRLSLGLRQPMVSHPDYKSFMLGAVAWSMGAATVLAVTIGIQLAFSEILAEAPTVFSGTLAGAAGLGALIQMLVVVGLTNILLAAFLKSTMAWAMLHSEVLALEAALNPSQGGSLASGRERLRWLVSRDVSELSEAQVRESAIESLAENLNDSVVAPIFWFLLFGLPGAALYRYANTADSMWGYRGQYQGRNWEWAGKWAARVDDVMSWLPARLTALLVLVLAGGFSLRTLRSQAAQTPSPNSGWPMAAMAMALGVSLRKPGVYVLNQDQPTPCAADTLRATLLSSKVVVALVFVVIPAIFLIAFRLSR